MPRFSQRKVVCNLAITYKSTRHPEKTKVSDYINESNSFFVFDLKNTTKNGTVTLPRWQLDEFDPNSPFQLNYKPWKSPSTFFIQTFFLAQEKQEPKKYTAYCGEESPIELSKEESVTLKVCHK